MNWQSTKQMNFWSLRLAPDFVSFLVCSVSEVLVALGVVNLSVLCASTPTFCARCLKLASPSISCPWKACSCSYQHLSRKIFPNFMTILKMVQGFWKCRNFQILKTEVNFGWKWPWNPFSKIRFHNEEEVVEIRYKTWNINFMT